LRGEEAETCPQPKDEKAKERADNRNIIGRRRSASSRNPESRRIGDERKVQAAPVRRSELRAGSNQKQTKWKKTLTPSTKGDAKK